MKKTAFARSIVLTVVAVMVVTVLTGCKTQSGTLNWGTDPTYAPFEYADANNKSTGFDVELMEAIAAKMGKTSNLTSGAFDGLLLALQGKKFEVLISSMTITPEREKEVSFSIPYYRADMGIVFDKTLHTIAGPSDLAGLRVGAQVGTTGETSARMIDGVTDVRSYPDIQLAMADLTLGRIDAVVNDFPVSAFYAKASPTLTVISVLKVKDLDLTQYYGIAMHVEDEQLKAAVDKALQDLVNDGTYDTIYAKWFGGTPGFRPGDPQS